MKRSKTRRSFLKTTTAGAAAAGLVNCGGAANSTVGETTATVTYESLGMRPIINGIGVVTVLGGSVMPPEVIAAMVEASKNFIDLPELQVRVGKRIAEIIGVPAATISCGAASGLTLATAACVTRGDGAKLRQLPDTTGIPNEVIVQKSHRFGFDTQIWMVGVKPVEVETREELEKAISDRTAMMFFLNVAEPKGQISRHEWVEVAKKHGIPTMNDCASDVPPASRLRQYIDEGFDLAVFSGGKGLLGPQASGLVLGNAELVDAALKANSPRAGVGRGMKVGKEEIMGLLAAVERYHRIDHEAERKELDMRAEHVTQTLSAIDGVETSVDIPEIANQVPHVMVRWDAATKGLTPGDAVKKLREGDPAIAVSQHAEGLRISMWMLKPGEHEIVATRVKELFA